MEPIYLLQNDGKTIESMQAGALDSTSVAGLKVTHGLIGTSEWWESIKHGVLKLHNVSGEISNFWPGQWSGGPAEFEIRQQDGTKSIWLCNIEPIEAKKNFIVGRAVELDYVCQELKTPFNGRSLSKVCIAIRLGSKTP